MFGCGRAGIAEVNTAAPVALPVGGNTRLMELVVVESTKRVA